MLFAKLQNNFERDKALREKKVAQHWANVKLVGCRATMWRLFSRRIEAFQAGEGVGVAEGVAVGDVLLPAAGLPFAVLLGDVLAVELSEGYGFGLVLILGWSKGDILDGWVRIGVSSHVFMALRTVGFRVAYRRIIVEIERDFARWQQALMQGHFCTYIHSLF